MATEIRVPALGESVTEATIGQWFKKVGDVVAADEPVVELETDKVTIEVPAPAAGVLEAISANPGDTVNVGALIGAIGEGAVAAAPKPAAAKPVEAPKPAPVAAAAPAAPAAPAPAPAMNGNGAAPPPAPAAAKLMADNGIAPDAVNGSGKRGQVLKEDVLATMAAGRPRRRRKASAAAARPRSSAPPPSPRRPRSCRPLRPRPPPRRSHGRPQRLHRPQSRAVRWPRSTSPARSAFA